MEGNFEKKKTPERVSFNFDNMDVMLVADDPKTSVDVVKDIYKASMELLERYSAGEVDWHDGPVIANVAVAAIAGRKDVPSDVMRGISDYVLKIGKYDGLYIKLALTKNPNTPTDVLDSLISSPNPPGPEKDYSIRESVRKHPNTSQNLKRGASGK